MIPADRITTREALEAIIAYRNRVGPLGFQLEKLDSLLHFGKIALAEEDEPGVIGAGCGLSPMPTQRDRDRVRRTSAEYKLGHEQGWHDAANFARFNGRPQLADMMMAPRATAPWERRRIRRLRLLCHIGIGCSALAALWLVWQIIRSVQ